MYYLLALLAACSFALGTVLQQRGTLEVPAGEDDPRFLAQILRKPVWLAGSGCLGAGWVLQAAALDRGPLVAVQALIALSLVIALPLGALITDQLITARVVWGALAVVTGIAMFLAGGSPQVGSSRPTAAAWWSAGVASTLLVSLLFVLGRRRHGAIKALVLGSAAGIAFALQATVTKEFVALLGGGVQPLLSSWTIYVLIATALVGFVLQQTALKTGVLAPAIASSNAMTLFASVVLGITVFDEALSDGSARMAPALVGLGVALGGIVLLAAAPSPGQAGATSGLAHEPSTPRAEERE